MIRAAVLLVLIAAPAAARDLPDSCAELVRRYGLEVPARPTLVQRIKARVALISLGCDDDLARKCRAAVGPHCK